MNWNFSVDIEQFAPALRSGAVASEISSIDHLVTLYPGSHESFIKCGIQVACRSVASTRFLPIRRKEIGGVIRLLLSSRVPGAAGARNHPTIDARQCVRSKVHRRRVAQPPRAPSRILSSCKPRHMTEAALSTNARAHRPGCPAGGTRSEIAFIKTAPSALRRTCLSAAGERRAIRITATHFQG